MREIWKSICTSFLMGMVLPGILLNTAVMVQSGNQVQPSQPTETTQPPGACLMVRIREEDLVRELELDEYLVGVVLAEMPASFEWEALKAQSVAARTYVCKALRTGGKHGDGSVCNHAMCCQSYLEPGEFLQRGGTEEGLEQVRSAVEATSGYVLTYDGELIEATYFSSSGGRTEAAVAVWGAEYPYLQAVPSPEEAAMDQTDTVALSARAFQKALGTELSGDPGSWFGAVCYTEGGGVDTMVIGGQTYTGTQLRSLLNLRSTWFTIDPGLEIITITTRGYGHRVGMSQYGADAMAASGKDFSQILSHYYPGTQLMCLGAEKG